ncbi:MAG: porin [Acidovorax sp.]
MKTKFAAIALALPAASFAQSSSVTLYGLIDSAVTYQTHANSAGQSFTGLQQGGEGFLSGSRFGLKGTEDLGGGTSAGFVLENGFLADTGGMDQQGQIFGRQAFVSLRNDRLGEVSAGRLYTSANALLYWVDPLGVGAAPSNAWMVFLTGQRYNNALQYANTWGAWSVLAQYALGETAGNSKASSSTALGVKYAAGPITAVGDFQQTRDYQDRAARIYLAGVKAAIGSSTALFANYIHSSRDANFDSSKGGTDTASITSMTTAATAANSAGYNSVFGTQRRDDFLTLGATYAINGNLGLSGAYMYDLTRADGFRGHRATLYGVVDYAFSKRTDVYLAAAYDRVGGDWSGVLGNSTKNWTGGSGAALNGNNNQTTLMVGLRHKF